MVSFNCIAIETSTARGSVAACKGDRTASVELPDSQTSSRHVYRALHDVLEQLGLDVTMLDCVAFGCGPGSFTGVRVAAAAAQGIAYARAIPVCRVSTLEALAMRAMADRSAESLVAACVDARMGEAYLGIYQRNAAGLLQAFAADTLINPDDFSFADMLSGVLAAGNGWDVWPQLLDRNRSAITAIRADVSPDAAAVLAIARQQYASGSSVAAADGLPNYIRDRVTQ